MPIIVAKDNSGDFSTITEALDSIPYSNTERQIILVREGTYKEKLTIDKPYITLKGESTHKVILTYDDSSSTLMQDGTYLGTFRSQTLFIDADDISVQNITVYNTAGTKMENAKALAVYIDGDRISFKNCAFYSDQTIFNGPLPPTDYEKCTFTAVKELTPRNFGRHYFKNCYIEGVSDIIFGTATAYFEHCTIKAWGAPEMDENTKSNGHFLAPATCADQEFGYVFSECRFCGPNRPSRFFIGHSWREYAKAVLIHCELDEHIHPEGWHHMRRPNAIQNSFFAEYNCYGFGADTSERISWLRTIDDEDLLEYSKENVLAGADNWGQYL